MKDYIQRVLVTKAPVSNDLLNRLNMESMIDILHGLIGVQTETGEIADAFKRHIFYGKMPDGINFAEEVGDILWYLGIILNRLNLTFDQCMEANIRKLAKRYEKNGKFDEASALIRDLGEERKVLEENLSVPEPKPQVIPRHLAHHVEQIDELLSTKPHSSIQAGKADMLREEWANLRAIILEMAEKLEGYESADIPGEDN